MAHEVGMSEILAAAKDGVGWSDGREMMRVRQERRQQEQERLKQEGEALSTVDPQSLKDVDLREKYGDEVIAAALLAISNKPAPMQGGNLDRNNQMDPELFSLLAKQIPKQTWNDTVTSKRGLGPRVCQTLWNRNGYDQIVELIKLGVDTSLAARADSDATWQRYLQRLRAACSACRLQMSPRRRLGRGE